MFVLKFAFIRWNYRQWLLICQQSNAISWIVYKDVVHEVGSLHSHHLTKFVLEEITTTSSFADYSQQKNATTLGFVEGNWQEITTTSSFTNYDHQKIATTLGFVEDRQENTISSFVKDTPQETWVVVEVNDYHLIFDLNGVLVVIGEGQIKFHLVVLRPNLNEFFPPCVRNSPCTYGH